MLFGMSYTEAMALPAIERMVMSIVMGRLRGGDYDYKGRKWKKAPFIM